MKFTNDITFNKLPRSNDVLKITYSGSLFKDNSPEVYIVYGFGENWNNTTEQKMEKRNYGFVTNIKIEDSNTFNFCFRNSNQNWDNNNSYISSIFSKPLNTEIQPLDNKEAEKVCSNSLDDILNSIDLELETSKTQNIEISEDLNVLDTLIQELFEEYNAKIEINSSNENSSLSNDIQETNLDKAFEETLETEELSNVEYFTELSNLFDNIIQNIEQNNTTQDVDIGKELNELFENTFTQNFTTESESSEVYIPSSENIDYLFESEELNNTFHDIVKNISEVETKTNTEVNTLNYDYSDFNAMFSFAQNLNTSETTNEENIFDFSNLDFDFNMNTVTENAIETDINDETIFDFSNPEFDFTLNNTQTITDENSIETIENSVTQTNYTNNFSDSFYDDEDISTHETYTTFDEIVNNVSEELEQEVTNANLFEKEEFQKQNKEFENAISEYAQYFDNLIEEIV